MKLIAGLFLLLMLNHVPASAQQSKQHVVAGYLTIDKFHPYDWQNVPFDNLTHIIQSFMCPVSATNPDLKYNGNDSAFINYAIKEKSFLGYAAKLIPVAHSKNVKVILGICGGFDKHARDLQNIFLNEDLRKTFINNIINICKQYNFDGVDLDYEYPSSTIEGNNITKFVKDLYDAVKEDNTLKKLQSFTITLACPKLDGIGKFFDFEKLANYCDWFNIMTYGYNAGWTKFAGFNCPLYADPAAVTTGDDENVSKSMYDYFHLQRKVPLDKLVIGLGFYGWMNKGYSKLYGPKSQTVSLSYAKIAEQYLDNKDWVYHWSDVSKVPYLTNDKTKEMITYDNEKSIGIKCDYAIEKGFRGVMIWELSRGFLSNQKTKKQPLIKVIGTKYKSVDK